jgi:hypothetical protein
MADDDVYFKWSSDGTSFWFPNMPAFEEDVLASMEFVVTPIVPVVNSDEEPSLRTFPSTTDFASFKQQLLSLGKMLSCHLLLLIPVRTHRQPVHNTNSYYAALPVTPCI